MRHRQQSKSLIFLIAGLTLAPFRLSAIVTTGMPDNYLTPLGLGLDGVAYLEIFKSTNSVTCSGVLLPTGRHLLTAAHCVADSAGNPDFFPELSTALFETADQFVQIGFSSLAIHPDYQGDAGGGNDLAVLTLSSFAPAGADRYPIYRGNNELGQVGEIVGYGSTGQGRREDSLPPGLKRAGFNRLEAYGSPFPEYTGGELLLTYDFDNGLPANDGFGIFLGLHDLGEGLGEVFPSFGDSGGPTFLNGAIAGLHSFSFRKKNTSDIDGFLNQSFGEFTADVRVSKHAKWIDSVVAIPEPSTLALLLLGGVLLLARHDATSRIRIFRYSPLRAILRRNSSRSTL